jgi:hypothetical protein
MADRITIVITKRRNNATGTPNNKWKQQQDFVE